MSGFVKFYEILSGLLKNEYFYSLIIALDFSFMNTIFIKEIENAIKF